MSTLELLAQRKTQLEKQLELAKKDNRQGLVNTYNVSLQHVRETETTLRMINRILAKHEGKDYKVEVIC